MVRTSTNWQRDAAETLPALEYKDSIIALFNSGALLLDNAKWYHTQGYAFVMHAGKVLDIVREAV